ncbi:hypothetical protein BCR43DRAFT_86080 [Syncephalastrum racemosum]|uniref:E3 UFM1-protein ligase 1-like N-terminal domain-containing protein n=1 Tax=Syncephalastrum racemosum TaxID=13706 RepID=A0A1X2H4D9_SYNRA|nr:hypothetical protein BCR43DRAFT_86080 [Syncephalastrum racemosum]
MSIPPDVLDQFLVQMVEQGLRTGHLTNFIRQQKSTPSYMSQTALDRAIVSAMDKQGRLYASEFSGSLDIPLQTVIHAWSVLAPQYEWLVMDDVALTSDYVAKIVDRLQVQINDAGCLSMVTLAQQLGLPYALIQKILDPLAVANDEDDSKDLIIYPQLSNLILTRRYANDAKERLQGALDQATQPLSMFKLQRELLLEEESLFYVLLDAVIKRSSSAGVFRGRHDKAVYVPHVYRDAQMDLIKSLVAAGGYIEYETVERSYPYSNPKDLLARHFPDIIFLPTCAVTPACLDEQESIAENALKSKEAKRTIRFCCSRRDRRRRHGVFSPARKIQENSATTETPTKRKQTVLWRACPAGTSLTSVPNTKSGT